MGAKGAEMRFENGAWLRRIIPWSAGDKLIKSQWAIDPDSDKMPKKPDATVREFTEPPHPLPPTSIYRLYRMISKGDGRLSLL